MTRALFLFLAMMTGASPHALDLYVSMNQGYHEYGIEREARPVNE